MLFLRAEPQQHIAALLLLRPIKVKVRFHSCLAVSCSYVFTKMRFSRSPHWRLSTASPQQSAVNSTMIHTWRIELSKVDRMCNLQGGGGSWLWVSRWRMKDYHVLWQISCQREGRAASCLEALHVPSKPMADRHHSKQKDFPPKQNSSECLSHFGFFKVKKNKQKKLSEKSQNWDNFYMFTKTSAAWMCSFTAAVSPRNLIKNCIQNTSSNHLNMNAPVTSCLQLHSWLHAQKSRHIGFLILCSRAVICNCTAVLLNLSNTVWSNATRWKRHAELI